MKKALMKNNQKKCKIKFEGCFLRFIRIHKSLQVLGVAFILVGLFAGTAFAGTSGKIAGTVLSVESGEPLAGATVSIVGLKKMTVADIDGEFYIINIPIGTYDLVIDLIGYRQEIRNGVRVMLDLTTPIKFNLMSEALALDQSVTVIAERPLIQKDLTASIETITREELAVLPNARNIDDILLTMSGTVSDEYGQLHVRGGRNGQVTYYLDGMPVQNQFGGNLGTRVTPEALEEVSLATGGFSAEYGEALSGVVNALTREGGNKYQGMLKLSDGMQKPYDVNTGEFGALKRNDTYYSVFNLSGPFPFMKAEHANFFNSVEYRFDRGYLPHNSLKSWSMISKVALHPRKNLKLTLYSNFYDAERNRFQHRDVNGYSYDFDLDNSGLIKSNSYRVGGRSTLQLSQYTMFTVKMGYFQTRTKLAPNHLFDSYWDQWPGYSENENGLYDGDIQDNYRTDSTTFYTGFVSPESFYPYYLDQFSSYKTLGFDFLSQVNKNHQMLIGGEYRANRLKWDNKQFFNVRPYGEQYDVNPSYAAGYIQDKIELGYMVINAGLRFDYLNAKMDYWDDPVEKNVKLSSKSKTHISPRLGFSHPVSDQTVFHFNYGFYYQVPSYPLMFTNLQADLTTGFPIIGNPDLEPEKTILYEFGVNHQLAEDTRISVTTYFKDISNLVSTRMSVIPGGSYVQYYNGDYGSVKGLDLILMKQPISNLSGTVNYSYMIAEGNSSDANEFYYNYFTALANEENPIIPVEEYPLTFDQRHTLTVNVDYRIGRNEKPKLFGMTLPSAWGFNALFRYGSGMPYTKTDQDGLRIGGINESRMPATYRVDLRMDKNFFFSQSGSTLMRFFLEVHNLFDRRNITNVYSRTGSPSDDGYNYILTEDPEGPATADDVNDLIRLLAKDPQNYDTPRSIHWGLEFIF